MNGKSRPIALPCLALCALLGCAASAHAIPLLKSTPFQVGQVNSSAMARLGLVVEGWADSFYFTLGGGYTLTCQDSPLPISLERSQPFFSASAKHNVVIAVPATAPGQYAVAGFSSWAQSSCHLCNFQYRGRAVEAATSVAVSGAGVAFTFNSNGGLEATEADVKQFHMCKYPPTSRINGGCYP